MERLDKIISSSFNITRSQAKSLIKSGTVKIDGKTAVKPDMKCAADDVTVNGKNIVYKKHVYIMLNKPAGVVSAGRSESDITVTDILPDEMKRKNLFPAGRLDKDTVGFVLITDDGDFAHNILSPRRHVEKTYEARLDSKIDERTAEKFRSGITLADGTKCRKAELEILENKNGQLCRIKITEGKYHQIKRMFAADGVHVTYLKRTAIGGLALDPSLREGEARYISEKELKQITDSNNK